MKINKTPQEFGYVIQHNLCLFLRGPLSQWWSSFAGQEGGGIKIEAYKFYCPVHMGEVYKYICEQYGVDGIMSFNCLEQWMMACKAAVFDDLETLKKIMATNYAKEQKALGRLVKNYDQKVWDQHKYHVVLTGNQFKFEQNENVREFLMQFNKNTLFVECNKYDKVWACGLAIDDPRALDVYAWQGENLLGEVIREVRRGLN
jgi:ribA/ribD-fused uncharacterized protein